MFVAGGEWDRSNGKLGKNGGVVVKFDGISHKEVARRYLPAQWAQTLTTSGSHVVVTGHLGRVWIHSVKDLSIQRMIDPDVGPFMPQASLAFAERLYITTHAGQGDFGSFVAIDDWSPDAAGRKGDRSVDPRR